MTEGPPASRELMELGLHFDEREVSGHREPDLGREGGHSKRRVLHVQDVTGRKLRTLCCANSAGTAQVELLENHMAVDLITAGKLGFATEDRCLGVYVLDEKSGRSGDHPDRSAGPGHGRVRESLSLHDQPGHRDRRRRGHGLARGRGDREHGIHPISSDLSFSSEGEIVSDFRSGARARAAFCGTIAAKIS